MAKGRENSREEDVQVRYSPADPSRPYRREEFVFWAGQLEDLVKYKGAISKDSEHLKARKDLCKVIFGDSSVHLQMSGAQVRDLAKKVVDAGEEGMAKYVAENLNLFYHKISDEGFMQLALTLPFYMNGEREHDGKVSLIGQFRQVQEIAQQKDQRKMAEFVIRYAQDRDKMKKEIESKPEAAIEKFNQTAQRVMQRVGEVFVPNGKVNRYEIKKLINENLRLAEEELDDEKFDDKRRDIWNDDIKPIYLGLAQALYASEKPEYEKNIYEVKEMRGREEKRAKLGMAA